MALGFSYYCTEQGNEPVKQWLKDLPKEVRFAIGVDIRYLQEHWPEANQMPRVVHLVQVFMKLAPR